ncbi:hypothetical protein [Sulfuriflexus mobilis]|uniref:hypothetical protein n=1 Tax=Sulfuriflexus mobilis TaxID=1811807 RepID=UPI0011D01AF1|nr:hypothetical protein [Sulfuriflexus mobilis]
MSKKIPDFTDSQIWTVESTLAARFKKKIETQIIDSENRLHPHDRELPPVTGLYCEANDGHFVIFQTDRSNTAASFLPHSPAIRHRYRRIRCNRRLYYLAVARTGRPYARYPAGR